MCTFVQLNFFSATAIGIQEVGVLNVVGTILECENDIRSRIQATQAKVAPLIRGVLLIKISTQAALQARQIDNARIWHRLTVRIDDSALNCRSFGADYDLELNACGNVES